ncbi:MAG: lipopolysaccharide biosynthesis protein [Lachnospiraceae bacterium]
MKTNLVKNTIWLSIGTVLSKGLLFIMLPLFTAWLTTEEYGIFDLLYTYVSLLIPVLTLATGEGVFRFSIESSEQERKQYITNGFGIITLNYILFAVVLIIVNMFVPISYLGAFLLLLLGSLLNEYLSAYLRATKQLKIYSFSNAISVVLIALMVTLLVYFLHWGVQGILLGYAIGYIVGDFLILLIARFFQNFSFYTMNCSVIRRLVKYSVPLVLNNISWWFMNVSDRSMVSYYWGNGANGIYAIACKIPSLCTAIFSVFNISWQQTASEMINEAEIEAYFNQVYNRMVRVLVSICSGILACNFLFFQFFFENKYYEAHYYVGLLVTAAMLLSLSQFYGGVQIALKQPKWVGYTTAIGAIVNVVLNVATIQFWGLTAASATTLIGNAVILLIRKIHVEKKYCIRVNKDGYLYLMIYLYFAISSYFVKNMIFNCINLLLAVVLFCIINKDYGRRFVMAWKKRGKQ